MSQTTVEVIDPKHQHFGQVVTVKASYDWIWIFGETAEHCNVSLHASQVKVLSVHDPDIWIEIVGRISTQADGEIRKELASLPNVFVAGGWTGERGKISLKFEDSASAHLAEVQEIAVRYGLEARKLKQTPIVNPEAPVIDSQG